MDVQETKSKSKSKFEVVGVRMFDLPQSATASQFDLACSERHLFQGGGAAIRLKILRANVCQPINGGQFKTPVCPSSPSMVVFGRGEDNNDTDRGFIRK